MPTSIKLRAASPKTRARLGDEKESRDLLRRRRRRLLDRSWVPDRSNSPVSSYRVWSQLLPARSLLLFRGPDISVSGLNQGSPFECQRVILQGTNFRSSFRDNRTLRRLNRNWNSMPTRYRDFVIEQKAIELMPTHSWLLFSVHRLNLSALLHFAALKRPS